MVDEVGLTKGSSVYFNQITSNDTSNHCINCSIVKFKYEETPNELKSARLIIDLLRTEITNEDTVSNSQVTEGLNNSISLSSFQDQSIQHTVHNNLNDLNKDQSNLEIMLDRNELHELYSMAVRPAVQHTLLTVIYSLEQSILTSNKILNRQNGTSYRGSISEVPFNNKINQENTEEITTSIPTIMTSKISLAEEMRNKIQQTVIQNKPRIRPNQENNEDRNKSSRQSAKCKILLIGDSHIKGLSSELRYKLGNNYEILGIAKPNATASQLTITARQEASKLTRNDILIYWGGYNDIAKNNSNNGLFHEITYLRNNQHTNNIIIAAPH
jgi:hypothetical protein